MPFGTIPVLPISLDLVIQTSSQNMSYHDLSHFIIYNVGMLYQLNLLTFKYSKQQVMLSPMAPGHFGYPHSPNTKQSHKNSNEGECDMVRTHSHTLKGFPAINIDHLSTGEDCWGVSLLCLKEVFQWNNGRAFKIHGTKEDSKVHRLYMEQWHACLTPAPFKHFLTAELQ